ncbi:energy-coupling factor transporter transmembrane component T family protein [Desulfonatronum thioautotrophicum]|uniref:energy-coupling factor transporter transmembrane component T family protein n=1 Tax=Desulfonatronum thioautotrophicum TaxID=617001 RepID=UPI0005EB6DF1|nr:energy-coupling factor transporter transmembrane component T [Desulfonatronum thioautotrophicum]
MLGKILASQDSLSHGASRLHRMDARIKILTAMVCLMAVSGVQGHEAGLAALIFGLGLTRLAGLHLANVALRLAPANIFFVGLGLVLGLTYPGPPLTAAPWLSLDGLSLALRISLKGNALLLIFIALLCTSSVPALSQALHRLGVPRKLPLLLALTFRQLFLVAEEYHRLYRAALARGFAPSNSRHTYRTVAVLFGQTLLRALARAERIHGAMLLRGFSGQFHTLRPGTWGFSQAALATGLCIPPALITVLDRWPW